MICLFNELGRGGVLRHLSNISDEIVGVRSQSRYWRQSQYSPISTFLLQLRPSKAKGPHMRALGFTEAKTTVLIAANAYR